MSDQRQIDIETKVAHNEISIEALHEMVYGHQKEIALLKEALENLAKRFEGSTEAPEIGTEDEKPPHY